MADIDPSGTPAAAAPGPDMNMYTKQIDRISGLAGNALQVANETRDQMAAGFNEMRSFMQQAMSQQQPRATPVADPTDEEFALRGDLRGLRADTERIAQENALAAAQLAEERMSRQMDQRLQAERQQRAYEDSQRVFYAQNPHLVSAQSVVRDVQTRVNSAIGARQLECRSMDEYNAIVKREAEREISAIRGGAAPAPPLPVTLPGGGGAVPSGLPDPQGSQELDEAALKQMQSESIRNVNRMAELRKSGQVPDIDTL